MSPSPDRENLFIPGPAGALEALLEWPAEPVAEPACVAVVCHPHPLYQGTMQNKVVHTVARAMHELGMPSLRFNFRGVGQSEGEYGEGDGETEDLLAAVEMVRERWPSASLWLSGFSFGGVIAARAAATAEAAQLVTIAPAVNVLGRTLPAPPRMPWLIVQGEDDDIVPAADVRAWVATCEPTPELVVLPDTGHFFHGRLVTLRRLLVERLTPAVTG
jgi:alpha/beta superfamily hydrolase